MAKEELCVLTNMCMIYDENRVLVQKRVDPNWSGISFPGGHIEPNESFVDSVIREIKEETGLNITNVELCGVKQFPYNEGKCRYIVFLYKTNTYSGKLIASDEGEVFWVNKESLKDYVLADGFEELYEVFENNNLTENYWWIEDNKWKVVNK